MGGQGPPMPMDKRTIRVEVQHVPLYILFGLALAAVAV